MSIEAMKRALEDIAAYYPNSWAADRAKAAIQQAEAQQPATGEPVLFIHPDTFAMNNAHVGAWKPGHELTGYIPLYTHPAPSVPDVDFDLICNAVDKADTITMEGDYMLDSDDCIAVVRVMQVLLSVRAAMLAAK